jgi:hypothetical protein
VRRPREEDHPARVIERGVVPAALAAELKRVGDFVRRGLLLPKRERWTQTQLRGDERQRDDGRGTIDHADLQNRVGCFADNSEAINLAAARGGCNQIPLFDAFIFSSSLPR